MAHALRGVNLGGWLLSEQWMTPELYEGVTGLGERAIGRQLGMAEARRRIGEHRDTFVTEADFAWLAEHGYAFVRLPVGYWLFTGDDPTDDRDDGFVGGAEHVDQAFVWAERHGLTVLLDLHGLPGSQNGRDHSGQVGRVTWHHGDNPARALQTVSQVARTYGDHDALLGLELINEPWLGLRSRWLIGYYDAAYAAAAEHVRGERKIIVSDAYQARRIAWHLGRRRRRMTDQLVLDVHLYRLFMPWQRRQSFAGHLRAVERHWRPLLTRLARRVPLLIGEWTAELPPRALAEDRDGRVRAYFATQQDLFDEVAWAHSYWSYTTRSSMGAWSLRDADLARPAPR